MESLFGNDAIIQHIDKKKEKQRRCLWVWYGECDAHPQLLPKKKRLLVCF